MEILCFRFYRDFSPALFTEKMWRFYKDFCICYKISVNFTKIYKKNSYISRTFYVIWKRNTYWNLQTFYRDYKISKCANLQTLKFTKEMWTFYRDLTNFPEVCKWFNFSSDTDLCCFILFRVSLRFLLNQTYDRFSISGEPFDYWRASWTTRPQNLEKSLIDDTKISKSEQNLCGAVRRRGQNKRTA